MYLFFLCQTELNSTMRIIRDKVNIIVKEAKKITWKECGGKNGE